MPRVRVHQHVNPLSPYYRQEPAPVALDEVFDRADQPFHLDIGCARGRFILRMAEAEPCWNFLGVEIREPLVTEANRIAREAGLKNLHYAFCNAMFWLDRLLSGMPFGVLRTVTIQFPDPWFKNRHAKRRMVNRDLIDTVSKHLPGGGMVFIQSDIAPLADEMFVQFRAAKVFEDQEVRSNPFPVKTEREKAVEAKGLPVYRAIFVKK